jgi:hypothetical protein
MNQEDNEQMKIVYEALRGIEKEVSDLHNTLDYWIQRLLDNIEWKDDE